MTEVVGKIKIRPVLRGRYPDGINLQRFLMILKQEGIKLPSVPAGLPPVARKKNMYNGQQNNGR